jgi:hypothetical protein
LALEGCFPRFCLAELVSKMMWNSPAESDSSFDFQRQLPLMGTAHFTEQTLNDNDPSARAEALVALRNLAGKGTPPAELKSLSAHG